MYSMSNFVKYIEEYIYKRELVYRSIFVTKNKKDSNILKYKLENHDYSILILDDEIDYTKNYNKCICIIMIFIKIIILSYDKFIDFMEHLDNQEGGILSSTFNFIAFHYFIDDNIVNNLISYYITKTNNNINNTIIFDKTYANFLYLENLVS